MEIWTLAYDDNVNGTGCELFATEREAMVSLIERVTEDDSEERTEAMRLLDEDEQALWPYLDDNCFEMPNTYNVGREEVATPLTGFNDRELATVLHALRCLQELRFPLDDQGRKEGCVAAEDPDGPGGPFSCDHFDGVSALNNDDIDALCERLNLGPEEAKPYVPNAVELGFIEYARQNLATDEIEFDDAPDSEGNYPKVSQGADGAFVAAWVWVSNEQAGVESVPEPDPDSPNVLFAESESICKGCGREESECSADPCADVKADREEAADPAQAALEATAQAQRAYWDSLVDLETALGFKIDTETEIDYSNATVESLKEDYGPDEHEAVEENHDPHNCSAYEANGVPQEG